MPKIPPSILETALKLHDRGLSIVPCNGKGCIWTEWQKERRTREELAEALADRTLNIALVLNQSPWIDVECDSPEAEKALTAMFGGEISPTPSWESQRGKHRLFCRPPGLPNKAKLEIDGVEFRIGNGKGALSMLPPSRHPETRKRYRWLAGLSLDDVEPAELPPAIVERLRAPEPKPSAESSGDKIPEGKRNETLFNKACALKQLQLPEDAIATALLSLNAAVCDPPLPEAEVHAIAHSAATGDTKAKVGFLQRLFGEVELWHCENDEPHATLKVGEHCENWPIGKRCRAFRRWLSKLFYDVTGSMISAGDLADICSVLEGKAIFDGPRHQLFRRVAEHEGKFYLDLCEPEWRAVEIDADGWRLVADPPVKFRRAKAMAALPMPVKTSGRELKKLLSPFLNVRDEQWPNVAVWIVASLRPRGPYPVLKLLGEQGSAKTTTARACRSVIDPNAAPVRAQPRSTRDLMIAANNGWVICLDNLSTVKADLSDALCRLSTGGGFATRTLYTDEDETIFDAMRPVILTSIEEIGTRSDLLERSLIVELPPILEGKRRAEKQFWAEFEKVRPRILGALLDVVSGAIRTLPEIERRENPELPRLADFHVWGEAAEASLGLEPGTFAEAYIANREEATATVLESSPAICALLGYLRKNPGVHEMTAQGWLDKLAMLGNGNLQQQHGWPRASRVLSAILKRAAPNLRQVGIVAVQDTRGGGDTKKKIWRITGPSDPATPKPKPKPKRPKQGRKGSKGSKPAKRTPAKKTRGRA